MLTRFWFRRPNDEGVSLLIAILFVFGVGVWVVAIVQLAYPNLVTSGVVAGNRNTNYNADAALAQDITTIRYAKDSSGNPYGRVGGTCPSFNYPTSGTATVTVLCSPQTLTGSDGLPRPYEREVKLTVCAGASVSSCSSPLATADVHYYDDGTWGRAAFISDWSTR